MNNPSISPPFHQEDNNMNLLISPFEPDQFSHSDSFYSGGTTEMSPINMPKQFNLYESSPSPQPDMLSGFSATNSNAAMDLCNNEFISRSPESSSSADSNLVSPPHHYYPSSGYADFIWPESNHHGSLKRSASVPPHFHKFKPHVQDSMYNQFQVTTHQMAIPPSSKPLPIQIERVSATHSQITQPLDAETHRRQLDEKLEKVNFDDITVAELKEMLRERGLSATGRKAELMNRLKEEYDLLMSHGGASAASTTTSAAVTMAAKSSPSPSTSSLLQRRLANMNIESPKRSHQSRLYAPYSPPVRHSSISIAQLNNNNRETRLASSLPNAYTQSYLDEQCMARKPSLLRETIHQDDNKEWLQSLDTFFPQVPKIEENSTTEFVASDVWDDQTLQTFLSQI